MNDIFLGLDLGTSGCKLIAFDRSGRELARAARGYPVEAPHPGHAELDPDRVWAAAVECFEEVDARSLAGRVRTLAVACQGEAMLPVDRDGRVLAASPISADMRALAELAELERSVGAEKIYAITGQPASPIYSLPRLMWWKRTQPELFEKTWRFLCYGDFAMLRLGLPPRIDEGMAARTMAYDIDRRGWSAELLETAGASAGQLPEIAASGETAGVVPDGVAERLRLPAGVIVVVGGHDQPMSALGTAIGKPGTALYAIGTTESIVVVLDGRPPGLGAHNIPCYPHVVAGTFVGLAGSQSGARVLSWYHEAASAPDDRSTIEARLAGLTDTVPRWPLLLPHLAGSGSVLNDHQSLGALFGLNFEVTRDDLLLAVLEGITFEQALSLEALSQAAGEIESLSAVGGGTRSSLWLQMKADILGKPVTRLAIADAPCLGGAILGCAAISGAQAMEVANSMISVGQTFRPRPERHAAHAQRLAVYRSLYEALREPARQLRAAWSALPVATTAEAPA